MSKKKVIEDLDNLLTLFKSNFSESCASSYDSLNEFDNFSKREAKEMCKKDQAVAKGGSLSSDEFSTETNPYLLDLDVLLEELRSSKFLGRVDIIEAEESNHNSSCSEELSLGDKTDTYIATEELDSLMESLAHLGASTPSKNKFMIPNPIHPSVSLSSAAKVFSCSTSSLVVPHKVTLDTSMADLDESTEFSGVNMECKGSCATCGKVIVGDVVSVMGKTWHPQHFTCLHCKNPISDNKNFFERSGSFYCEKDFDDLFCPKCASCNGPIMDMYVTAVDRMWHPEHFVCHHCKKRLVDGDDFHEHDNEIYCRKDYCELMAPRCGKCKMAIVENFLSAMKKYWHVSCFVCFDCEKPMGADSVYEVDGQPYCCQHYHMRKGSLCHSCKQPIVGPCVSAMMRKFHPEHFVCCFCQGKLTSGIFKEYGEKPYCRHCYKRLFS